MKNEESTQNWRTGAIITGFLAVIAVILLVVWGFTATNTGGPIDNGPDNDIRSLIANPPSTAWHSPNSMIFRPSRERSF